MTDLPLSQRFKMITLLCFIFAILVAGCSLWRDKSHQANRVDSAEAEKRLEMAVRSLQAAPENAAMISLGTSQVAFDKLGANDKDRERMQERMKVIERKLAELQSNGRLKGRYYLDLNKLVTNVQAARKDKQPLYGTTTDTVSAAIRLLGQGDVLKLLIWREDLPSSSLKASVYWSQNVAKISEGFLAQKNPWGPVMGALLVEESITPKSKNNKNLLLKVTGQNVTYPNGINYADVRQDFPLFELSGEPALASVLSGYLDYNGNSLVNRDNRVKIGGRSVQAGYDVVLTLDPAMQSIASELAENALEGDNAKNATLVVMDLKTGEVLVGTGKEGSEKYNHEAVPLIFREILPASPVKIIFSAAMLEHADHFTKTEKGRQMFSQLPYYLMKSDPSKVYFPTAAFDYGGAALFSQQATRFGWNQGCSEAEQKGNGCGRTPMDFLFGSGLNGVGFYYPLTGRIFLNPGNGNFKALDPKVLESLPAFAHLAQNLGKKPNNMSQAVFDIAKLVRLSMFGQGDVHTSSFGLLNTIGHVANAANGQTDTPLPHLVRRVLTSEGKTVPTPAPTRIPVGMKAESARILAGYLTAVNSREGTAGVPFEKVFGRNPYQPQKELLFGKSGTTDSTSVGVPPLSLYVAAYSRQGKEYDMAVVAVIEREVLNDNYNRAADLAFRFIKATRSEPVVTKQEVVTKHEAAKKTPLNRFKRKRV